MRHEDEAANRPEATPSLDPADWSEMRELARETADEAMRFLETLRERPVWQPVPEAARRALRTPLPRRPLGARRTLERFRELILPYNVGNIHPRFWGWVNGNGTPLTVLAELAAATMNPNVYGSDSAPFYVEQVVLDWMKELVGLEGWESGILTSGGSEANFAGLACALFDRAPVDLRPVGVAGAGQRMMVYGSRETHYSVAKALTLLGLGEQSFVEIATDGELRIDVAELSAAVAADRRAGHLPVCVVGNAGTVGTGAFDPLVELAEFCRRERLWLHVDGAFGAFAAASPRLRHLTRGLERADSVAFDLHKWLHMPIAVGAVMVRDREAHRKPFAATAPYLRPGSGGLLGSVEPFGSFGLELTRPFRALKVWMGLLEQGADAYVATIENNVRQAAYLAARIDAEPALERLAPVPLNVVAFRYVADGWTDESLDELNRRLLVAVQESGVAVPSAASVGGRDGLRVAITNHRTVDADLDALLDVVVRLGDELAAKE